MTADLISPRTSRRASVALTTALGTAILALALIPLPDLPAAPGTDKLHHLIAFAALVLPSTVLYPRHLIWVIPCAVAEAGLIELIQPLVNRHREWADFVADLKGIAIGLGLGLTIRVATQSIRARRSRTKRL